MHITASNQQQDFWLVVILILSFNNTLILIGLIMIGVGCAPIYPSLLHETPVTDGFSSKLMANFNEDMPIL